MMIRLIHFLKNIEANLAKKLINWLKKQQSVQNQTSISVLCVRLNFNGNIKNSKNWF